MMICLASYLHNIDPYAIKLWDGGPIRWYGLSYLLGFLLGFLQIRYLCKRGKKCLSPNLANDLVVTLAIGVVLGGRIGYALFYQPALFGFSGQAPYWKLLAINHGGMASHGGIIGMAIASWYFAKKHNLPWGHILDLAALAAPLGVFFGRIANFINGELFGRPCSPTLLWGVKFPQELYRWNLAKLTTLSETIPAPLPSQNQNFNQYIAWVIEQIQKGNTTVIKTVEPYLTVRHPSQIYQALMEGLLLCIILWFVWRRPRKPWLITAWTSLCYGILRIIGECFRLPDAGIGFQWHLTRGQWLSLVMVIFGVVMIIWSTKRKAVLRGGWQLKPSDQSSVKT